MPCVCLPVLTCRGIASGLVAGEDPGASLIAEAPAQYRPRHPEKTAFYRLFQDHFDSYVRAYEQRFEPRSGPLRPVVVRSVEEFLTCGRLQGGFARIRCPECRAEHLLAFSCRTRNFCPSCQAKRSVLFAEKLIGDVSRPRAPQALDLLHPAKHRKNKLPTVSYRRRMPLLQRRWMQLPIRCHLSTCAALGHLVTAKHIVTQNESAR